MEIGLYIYLYSVLGTLSTVLGFINFIVVVIYAFFTISALGEADWDLSTTENRGSYEKSMAKIAGTLLSYKRFVLCTTLFVIVLNALVPSESKLKLIIGGAIAGSILTSDEAKKLPDNVLGAVNTFLEEFN